MCGRRLYAQNGADSSRSPSRESPLRSPVQRGEDWGSDWPRDLAGLEANRSSWELKVLPYPPLQIPRSVFWEQMADPEGGRALPVATETHWAGRDPSGFLWSSGTGPQSGLPWRRWLWDPASQAWDGGRGKAPSIFYLLGQRMDRLKNVLVHKPKPSVCPSQKSGKLDRKGRSPADRLLRYSVRLRLGWRLIHHELAII